jgi:PAS domain S-box-containing protein
MEENLGEIIKRIEFVLGATRTGVDIIDSHYNMVYIDPQWQKIYGDFRGKKCYEYFMGIDSVCPVCGVREALELKLPVVKEELLLKERNRPVQVTTMPFQNDSGEWLVAEVSVDITERKKIEEALRQEKEFAESMFNTAQAIILVLDKQGRIVKFNPYMEELLGYKLEEVKGKDWFDTFLPKTDHTKLRELFKKATNDVSTKGNVNPILTKSGREVLIEWYDKTLKDKDGQAIGLLSIGRDVTERKKLEEDAEKRFREMEILYKASVDREDKIIELKKIIEELKKK